MSLLLSWIGTSAGDALLLKRIYSDLDGDGFIGHEDCDDQDADRQPQPDVGSSPAAVRDNDYNNGQREQLGEQQQR